MVDVVKRLLRQRVFEEAQRKRANAQKVSAVARTQQSETASVAADGNGSPSFLDELQWRKVVAAAQTYRDSHTRETTNGVGILIPRRTSDLYSALRSLLSPLIADVERRERVAEELLKLIKDNVERDVVKSTRCRPLCSD